MKRVHPAFKLAIEPGRFLVAEAGVLLAHATQVVEKDGVRRVGLDAGMNALIRPALYEAWHDIANLSRLDDADDGDVRHRRPDLRIQRPVRQGSAPAARDRPGDVMLVADAGAYGSSMASEYNLRALPAEGPAR